LVETDVQTAVSRSTTWREARCSTVVSRRVRYGTPFVEAAQPSILTVRNHLPPGAGVKTPGAPSRPGS
jgi:hypothetical protein